MCAGIYICDLLPSLLHTLHEGFRTVSTNVAIHPHVMLTEDNKKHIKFVIIIISTHVIEI